MRICFDDDGYIKGCMAEDNSGFMTATDVTIPLPDGLSFREFAKEAHLYHLVDGALVKDEERAAQIEAEKPTPQATTEERLEALETVIKGLQDIIGKLIPDVGV